MMTDEGNEMEWPELPTHGHAEFTVLVREGHAPVLRRGAHDQEGRVDDRRRHGRASKVVVNWRASVWEPPSAEEQSTLHMDVFQTWEVVRSPDDAARR